MHKYLAFIATIGFSAFAQATLIDNISDPALANSNLLTFDGTTTQIVSSLTVSGVTFSTSNGALKIAPFGEGGSQWQGSGQTLTTRETFAPSSFAIEFSHTVSAFAMAWGAANHNWLVNVYDTNNELLNNIVFIGGDNGASIAEFYGVKNAGIKRATFTSISGWDWIVIDDFRFVTSPSVKLINEPHILFLLLCMTFIAMIRRSPLKKSTLKGAFSGIK